METTGRAPAGFYRAAEVARMLRCSEWWVKEQARQRRVPFCWIGGSYLFTEEHVAMIVRLFEVRPGGELPRGARRGSTASTTPRSNVDDKAVVLHARPPRGSRRIERP